MNLYNKFLITAVIILSTSQNLCASTTEPSQVTQLAEVIVTAITVENQVFTTAQRAQPTYLLHQPNCYSIQQQ